MCGAIYNTINLIIMSIGDRHGQKGEKNGTNRKRYRR